jgi:ubiquinone/menaquinone biosynthesis C-methylase UbiE
MLADVVLKQRWEAAEIERSALEAQLTPQSRLVAKESNVRRYMQPPLDTAYPLEYAFALLGDVRGKTVVDFGCGSGENSLLLARRGASVVGIDISDSLINLARRRLELNGLTGCARFVIASAHDVPLEDNSIDTVMGIAILHHLDLAATSREVHRILKPQGRAIFQEPVRDSRLVRAARRCIPYHAPDVSPYERPLTTPELEQFGRRFSSCSMRPFSLPFVNAANLPPLRRYIHTAYRYDRRLLQWKPSLAPLAGIRVLEVTK